MTNKPSLLNLFFAFFRLGVTAFGGPAMIAHIKDLSVAKKKWLNEETFRNGVALCQLIPGATAIQTAAYVGLKLYGALGALIAFVGFGLPAFLLMLALSALYVNYHILSWVSAIFIGLQVAVVSIVANATYTFGITTLKDYYALFMALGAALLFHMGISPFIVIILAFIAGIVIYRTHEIISGQESESEKKGAIIQRIFRLFIIPVLAFDALHIINSDLFDLSVLMMKVDLFAFGGGFASLPLMLHEIVNVKGWIDHKTFMDGIALGQITPGPIVITATFVGYLAHGLSGAITATIAIFTPSIVILIATAPMLDRLKSSPYFLGATKGALASFVGLLLFVTIKFALAVQWDIPGALLAASVLLALIKKVDILYIVPVVVVVSALIF
jgi:chromate transporter